METMDEVAFREACEAYRSGAVSLSKAAEMAGMSLRDMMARLEEASLELNYRVEDLKDDLREPVPFRH